MSPVQAICTEDKLIEVSLFSLYYISVRAVENGEWQSQLVFIWSMDSNLVQMMIYIQERKWE